MSMSTPFPFNSFLSIIALQSAHLVWLVVSANLNQIAVRYHICMYASYKRNTTICKRKMITIIVISGVVYNNTDEIIIHKEKIVGSGKGRRKSSNVRWKSLLQPLSKLKIPEQSTHTHSILIKSGNTGTDQYMQCGFVTCDHILSESIWFRCVLSLSEKANSIPDFHIIVLL